MFGLGVYTVYMVVFRLLRPHFGVLDVQIVYSFYCFYVICTKLHQNTTQERRLYTLTVLRHIT